MSWLGSVRDSGACRLEVDSFIYCMEERKMLAIKNAKVLPVTGDPIENGTVLVDGGKIVAVGACVEIPQGAEGDRRHW